MTEEQVRQLVREAVYRHLGTPDAPPRAAAGPAWEAHASHARFELPSGGDVDGSCLIEPAVACTHCGYCQSWGH